LAVRAPPELLDPLDDPLGAPPVVVLGALRGDALPADWPLDEPALVLDPLGHGERLDRDVMSEPDDGWVRV